MKLKVLSGALFAVLYFLLCPSISAQVASAAGKTALVSGKVALLVVGTSAKIAWKTTEFTAKEIAWPVTKATLKPMVTKVAPKVSIFLLKESGKAALKSLPVGGKLFLLYMKYRPMIP